MRKLEKFDRVRLKVWALGCPKGMTGTVVESANDSVEFLKDRAIDNNPEFGFETCSACRHEVAFMKDQTPNPLHLDFISK